jgi:SpoVK/Ycf46/Vps4 family AAA+-type ATPase
MSLVRAVSKYIADTEKHISVSFADGTRSGAALIFDEADALLGKRSEVRDSHDRYADVETGYLVHRFEWKGRRIILAIKPRRPRRRRRRGARTRKRKRKSKG